MSFPVPWGDSRPAKQVLLEFLKGKQNNCKTERVTPSVRSTLPCVGQNLFLGQLKPRVCSNDWPFTSAAGGQRGQSNYITNVSIIFLAWGVCAFPQLINILRVCLAVRVMVVSRVKGRWETRERRENNDNVISKQCFRSKSTLLMLPVF